MTNSTMWKWLTLQCMKEWLNAFHDYDSSFGVFFSIILLLLTIQFKGKKVLLLNCLITVVLLLDFLPISHFEKLSSEQILVLSRSCMICFQKTVLFFLMKMLNLLNIWVLVNIFWMFISSIYIISSEKAAENAFWLRNTFFFMHSPLIFEYLSLYTLYLWKCVLVFATKSFSLLVWNFFPCVCWRWVLREPCTVTRRTLNQW